MQLNQTTKRTIFIYHLLTGLYALGLSLWAATIYLYMQQIGYTYGQINLFLALFWLVTCVTEIPSGFLADRYGALKLTFCSAFCRGSGLLLLALVNKHIFILVLSAFLTALGDSLYSGTLTSWAVKQTKKAKIDQGKLFSHNYFLISLLSFAGGYFGADFLGNLNLRLPLISGALILYLTGILALSLGRFDTTTKQMKPVSFKFTRQIFQAKHSLIRAMILFLPLTFITIGPYNQWQLYFQHGHAVKTGLILVGINLCALLGTLVFNFITKIHLATEKLFLLHVFVLSTSVWLLVYSNYYLALFWLGIHVAFCASAEILQTQLLHEKITDDLRTTWISVSNTLEALVTTVALALNGFLADHFNLALAWSAGAFLGLIATCGWYFYQVRQS